jgi:hypothetical protein
MSKNLANNNLTQSRTNKTSHTNKIASVSKSIEKSLIKLNKSISPRGGGTAVGISDRLDSLNCTDSFIVEDRGEGQIKPIMEKVVAITNTLTAGKKTKNVGGSSSNNINTTSAKRKPIKISLIPSSTTINAAMKTPRGNQETSPCSTKTTTKNITQIKNFVMNSPIILQQKTFQQANKFLQNSNHKVGSSFDKPNRSITLIPEKMDFNLLLKSHNKKVNNFIYILEYLTTSEVKQLLKSFKRMKILIENSLLEKSIPILHKLSKFRDSIQLIDKGLIFSKLKGILLITHRRWAINRSPSMFYDI